MPRRPRPNTKRTGELAEAAFVVKATQLGFAVSKPWGDSERYDFILDAGHRTWRVQIKCTESLHANAYQVQSTYSDHKKKGHYTADDIDFLVAYIIPRDLWYVVPSTVLPPSASLRFYPDGNITRKPRFEQYREAWDLFRKKHLAPPRREPVATEPETSIEEEPQPDPPADPSAPEPKSPLLRRMEEVADRIYKFNYGRPRPRD